MIVFVTHPTPFRQWGENLRTLRGLAGFRSQKAFADALGVHKNAVQKWEAGERAPRDVHKARIARLLKVDAHVLFPLSAIQSEERP